MKKLVIAACFLALPSFSMAQGLIEKPEFDEKTKELSNKIILNIYYDVLESKDIYPELENFGEDALFENKHGVYALQYRYGDENDEDFIAARKTPYRFGVTIDLMADNTFPDQRRDSFAFGFPVLGIKFSGFQKKHLLRKQFDIMPFIEKHGAILEDHQQIYLPLRLTLKPVHDKYLTREDIEFEVELKNVSNRHMLVKKLGPKSLYFLLNDEFWGTRPTSTKGAGGGKNVVLKAGDSLKKRFKGESFQKSTDVNIYAVYRMLIDGVNPSGVLNIKVVE